MYVTKLYNQVTQPYTLPSHICHSTLQPDHPTIQASQSCMSLNFTTRSPNHSRCPVMYVTQLYNQVTQPFTLPIHVCHSTLQPSHPTIRIAQSCMSLNFTTRSLTHSRCLVMYVTQFYNQITQPLALPSHICHSTLQQGHRTIPDAQSCMSLNFTYRSLNHARCLVMYVTQLYNQVTQSFTLPSHVCHSTLQPVHPTIHAAQCMSLNFTTRSPNHSRCPLMYATQLYYNQNTQTLTLPSHVCHSTLQRNHPTIQASQSCMSLNFTTRSPNHSRCPVIYVTRLYNQVIQPFTLPSHVYHSTLQPGQPTINAAQSCMSLDFTTRSPNHSSCPVMYVTRLYNQVTQPSTMPSLVCHLTLQPGHPTIHAAQSCMSLNFTTKSPNHSRCPFM